jgi:hypothetical protein
MKLIAKTLFYTSITSYVIFAFAEYIRPGFVSYHFSLHWFLLPLLIGAFFWKEEIGKSNRLIATILRIVISATVFAIVWSEGAVFGDLRLVVALCAFALPWIANALLLSNSD